MPYNQRSFALKHHRGHTVVLAPCEQDYHYGQEPTWMVVRRAFYPSRMYRKPAIHPAGPCRSICHYERASTSPDSPTGCTRATGRGRIPSSCQPRQDITDREEEGRRSIESEREKGTTREVAITSQVADRKDFRRLLPNWSIKKEETRGD